MKLLLDTHVFLWFITGDPRLSPTYITAIRDANNEVFVSVVSIWETIVKHQLGKHYQPRRIYIYPNNESGIVSLRWPWMKKVLWFLPVCHPSIVTHSTECWSAKPWRMD
jgi:hypothetical protein